MNVKVGQKVSKGDVLVGFRLEPEVIQDLLRKTSGNHLLEMEVRNRELTQRLAELARKRKEVQSLARENLASAESLRQLASQVSLLSSQRKALLERLEVEKKLFEDDLNLLGQRLGEEVRPGHLPDQGYLTSPFDGTVVWINPQVRSGSEIGSNTRAITIGVMDPMILIAQAHETEAVGLKSGKEAFLVTKPFPDRRFKVTINRISWTPNDVKVDRPSYYQVEFTVSNPDHLLKEGYSGNVYIKR
jgi:multidrug efflux pump subunit AcrA (membrane-fusion protein)